MSHSLSTVPSPSSVLAVITAKIIDYPASGENFSLSELGAAMLTVPPSNQSVFCFQAIAPNQNSLGVPLIVTLDTAASITSIRVVLWQVTGGALAQIPATTALNATLNIGVRGA